MNGIANEIQKRPLKERLLKSLSSIYDIAAAGRNLRMSIPVQSEDEDVFISTTLQDALDVIDSIQCHSDSDGDCSWRYCPQLKNYKAICPLYKNYED